MTQAGAYPPGLRRFESDTSLAQTGQPDLDPGTRQVKPERETRPLGVALEAPIARRVLERAARTGQPAVRGRVACNARTGRRSSPKRIAQRYVR